MLTKQMMRKGRTAEDLFAPIAADLEAAERILQDTIDTTRPGVSRLLDHLTHYRGKRLRPSLLLLTARACGALTHKHHVLAAVVEMIHTATLVHDDVLDDATVRRHASTINAAWGNQASILLGDYLFTHAFHLTSTLGDAEACRLIGEATNRVCSGELFQICQRGNLELAEEAYFAMIDGKTAELTSCCCRLGALYAGMPEQAVEALAAFGRSLGMAFQIADDLLDLVGEERKAGKSLGTDLEQGKLTLPLIYLLRQAAPEKRSWYRAILESPENHKRELLSPDFLASGVIDDARRRAEVFAHHAAEQLACLPDSSFKSILESLSRRVIYRDE
ncbi:MAG: polyprenyl synthetase family protein [Gemmataceae bacterium]|nr:polyprenyl synthetase family protein [Gemmataceae bacterium]